MPKANLSSEPDRRAVAKAEWSPLPNVRQDQAMPGKVLQQESTHTLETPIKACRSHCLRTGVPLSSAGLARTMSIASARLLAALPGRLGCSRAAAVSGHSKAQAGWRHREHGGGCRPKVPPSRCPPTATPPSSADLATIRRPGRRGSSPAAAGCGPSKATSWSAPEPGGNRDSARPRHLRRAVRRRQHRHRGWVAGPGRRGCSPAAAVSGPSKATSWSAPARWETPAKASPSRCPATATPPSWAGWSDNSNAGAAWVFTRSGGVWTQQGKKLVGTGAVGAAHQGCPSRCPPTATPPSSAGLATIPGIDRCLRRRGRGGVGVHPQRRGLDPARRTSWSAPVRGKRPPRHVRRAVRRRQHRDRGRG